MYEYILLACSLFAVVLGTIIKKYYMKESTKGLTAVFLYNAITGCVSGFIIFLWGGIEKVSLFTLLLGIVFGLVTTLQTVTLLKAMEIGPMSYTTLINSFSTLIPTLSGALFFNEKIEIVHVLGIVLMIVSFILSVDKSKNKDSASIKWLIYSIIAFLCTGAIGVMQKIHQSSEFKGELNAFLVLAFAVSFVFAIILTFVFSKKENNAILEKSENGKINYIILLVTVIAHACKAGAIMERRIANISNAIGDYYACKSITIIERLITNRSNAITYAHACKSIAIRERRITNRSNTITYAHACKSIAIIERTITN